MKILAGKLLGFTLVTDSTIPRNELHLVNRRTGKRIVMDLGPGVEYAIEFKPAVDVQT